MADIRKYTTYLQAGLMTPYRTLVEGKLLKHIKTWMGQDVLTNARNSHILGERSFSKLKLIKTLLPAISQERLNNMAMLFKEICNTKTINFERLCK